MTMALQVCTDLMALVWQHPFFSCLILLLFTPPFFPIVKFFSPLLISTALFMLALFTMGPQSATTTTTESPRVEENWEFRRVPDVKVWEDRSVGDGDRASKRRKAGGNWMDWVSSVQEAAFSWIETKLKNENWKGSALNDDNVSILQEASWVKGDPSTSGVTIEEEVGATEGRVPALIAPSVLFKVDSKLKELALQKSSESADLGEDAPGLEDVVEEPAQVPAEAQSLKHASSVHHEPLVNLQIPKKTVAVVTTIESPSTDLDDFSDLERSRRFLFSTVRKNSMNAISGLSVASESDADTPVPVVTLSKSGKLKQMETLVDLIEDKEHAEKKGEEVPAHELAVLKPTTAEQVDAVKDKLESFTHPAGDVKTLLETEKPAHASSNPKEGGVKKSPGSPLFKEVRRTGKNIKKSSAFSDDDSSSGEEELSESDSDSEFEIFPL